MKPIRSFALALAVLASGLASGAEIREYSTRLDVDAAGAGRATGTLVIAGNPSETLDVPLSHPAWANFRLGDASEGLRLEPPAEKAATVRVTLPPAAGGSRLSFTYDVPEVFAKAEDASAGMKLTMPRDSRTLRYAFVNSQVTVIKDFRVLVVLPEGVRFQAIREQLPKQTRSEAEPRVRLGGEGGRQTALLRLANLRQGDDTSMQLEAVPGRRSLLWLVAGVVLSVLYLVKFRDLVSTSDGPAQPR
ncbi:MAG TPA: hypothetical protein PLB01_08355 [Thermoanaerobaculia bacterium]|nr:hypothetical protein [Thermoanaerobaculia bacterium]